jgi:uncharacterized protein (DUF488 family)
MPASGGTVLTIGHSTHSMDVFVALLQRHGVTAVADVRAAPYSRFNPQFNRESLASSLVACGIAYVFLGSELGGRSADPACYDNGRICYERLGAARSFQKGLDRIVQGAISHRIALMCAEKEPLECHRCLLVAPALEVRGVSVAHIGPDGRLELHADAMLRLLAMHGMEDAIEGHRLFPRSRAERIAEALTQQAHRFAHRNETLADGSAPPGRRNNDLQT